MFHRRRSPTKSSRSQRLARRASVHQPCGSSIFLVATLELKDCVIELLEQAKSRKKLPPIHGRASLLASLPIAAELVLNHQETLQAPDEAQPVDEAIANLAASLAYELSMNWGLQIEVWTKMEKKLGLTTSKSGADFTGTDGGPDSGFSLN